MIVKEKNFEISCALTTLNIVTSWVNTIFPVGFQPMNIASVSKQIGLNCLREAAYFKVHIQMSC